VNVSDSSVVVEAWSTLRHPSSGSTSVQSSFVR
jgi:hypothetical protein